MLHNPKTKDKSRRIESDSAPRSPLPGYRLDRLEVYNWGTFDGAVHSVEPKGLSTLLIGENGSGKSTLVDALLTLLVRPQTRNYNVAAGAGKNERDERSYIRGAYDRTIGEGGKPQVQVLRPGRGFYTVLLATFADETADKAFTIAQVLFLDSEGAVEKHYAFADRRRNIVDDLGNLSVSGVAKQLKERGFKATTSYKEYFEWLRKTAGFRSKAMEIFNQTVAVKDVQRLDGFIRRHMLESKPWQEQVGQLLRHFSELSEAHRTLVRIRRQYELLQPIVQAGDRFEASALQLQSATARLELFPFVVARRQLELLEPECEQWEAELQTLQLECDRLQHQIHQLHNDAVRHDIESEQAGSDRLRALPALIATAEQAAAVRAENQRRFALWLSKVGSSSIPSSAQKLINLQKQIVVRRQELQKEREQLQSQLDSIKFETRKLRETWSDDRRELKSLERSQGNLPESFIRLREKICRDLNLTPDDLPFAAELMTVKPKEKDWEASIEQVLFGLARSLIVPEKFYSSVAQYVEQSRLMDARGHGLRLVYLRAHAVKKNGTAKRIQGRAEGRLLEDKLDFRNEHPLAGWLLQEIQQRHSVLACESIEEFELASAAAMTRNRHFKSGAVRHEKDDRVAPGDRRHFVLGWDNAGKLSELTSAVRRQEQELAELNTRTEELTANIADVDAAIQAAEQIELVSDFDAVDIRRYEDDAVRLRRELEQLENSDDRVREMKQRAAQLRAQAASLAQDRDDRVSRISTCRRELRDGRQLSANCRRRLADSPQWESRLDRDAEPASTLADAVAQLSLENITSLPHAIELEWRSVIDALREKNRPAERELTSAMTRFLKRFPDEQQDLDAAVESLPSFRALHERIANDDLPRHEQRFKQRLNEKVLHEIGLFYGALETEREEIRMKIEQLNSALRLLQWKPGSYMQLDGTEDQDREIMEFRRELAACLSGSLDSSSELNEASFVRIEKLVEKLRDESNARWREKVIDVRNWFNFAAREIVAATGEVRSYYDGGAGQSGGEKGKLAFLVLVAAIAYQYDIRPNVEVESRFHFVMVDEMFSRSDDHHAEYALELFERFQLQLLIVAPLDAKARVTEPYVGSYVHVVKNKQTNRSELLSVTAEHLHK